MIKFAMPIYTTPSFIMLAPMEGVVDHSLRELYSAIGGIDRCVTEFIRVTQQKLPKRVFLRYCPELEQKSHTRAKTPVYLQLLGDHPEMLAVNALEAVKHGALAVDLNFGCPAKTVNSHGGGATLLQSPEQLFAITSTIRQALPTAIPLTAKIRLGFKDKSLSIAIAQALASADVSEIAVHGRTKVEGYKPPAYWQEIGKITQAVKTPIIANGEIWNLSDLAQCIEQSQTTRIMLGRGLIACPDLALLARNPSQESLHWGDICLLLLYYHQLLSVQCSAQYICSLIKQWLVYLRTQYADAFLFFEKIKRINDPLMMQAALHDEFTKQTQLRKILGHIGQLDLTLFLQQQLTLKNNNDAFIFSFKNCRPCSGHSSSS